jgi:hypothetical protein
VQKSPNVKTREIGVVSTLSLAAGDVDGSAVIRLWLVNHTKIAPLYIRVDVAAPPHCGEILIARVCMRLASTLPPLPTHTSGRRVCLSRTRPSLSPLFVLTPPRTCLSVRCDVRAGVGECAAQ